MNDSYKNKKISLQWQKEISSEKKMFLDQKIEKKKVFLSQKSPKTQ